MTQLIVADTVLQGWIKAVEYLDEQPEDIDFNLMLEITDPLQVPKQQIPAFSSVNKFLVDGEVQPLDTVANTIFPDAIYRKEGIKGLFETYPTVVYPKIKAANKWGTYFHRMVRRTNQAGGTINPLEAVIHRLSDGIKAQNAGKSSMRARYEMNTLDIFADLNTSDPVLPGDTYLMGGPCLSHLSFKLRPSGQLSLTGFYRSHYYIERALGNFIGLANLLNFVCKQTGAQAHSITVISSYAKIDSGKWGIEGVRSLISQCKPHL